MAWREGRRGSVKGKDGGVTHDRSRSRVTEKRPKEDIEEMRQPGREGEAKVYGHGGVKSGNEGDGEGGVG